MSPEPGLPPFENIRIATLSDVPRIASVAAAGFFWSPSFQFQRPYHERFPEDTISSYWYEYQSLIRDPSNIVLVAEDVLEPDESGQVYDALRKSPLHRPGMIPEARVVVGVCSIVLKPGSSLIGRIEAAQCRSHVDSSQMPPLLSKLNRDQCQDAMKRYGETSAPAKARFLAGQMRLGTLAVHPCYWGRGHGTRLVSWCARLADMEGAALGVSATPMGAALAARAGFEQREIIQFRHERPGPPAPANVVDVSLWIGVRPPSGSPSGTSTVDSESPVPDMRAL